MNNNLWQGFIVIAVTFSVAIVFTYALLNGEFSKISNLEIVAFILAIIIGFFWQITSNDRISNLILQVIYIISYIPTILGIIKGHGKEHSTAWVIAFVAYLFSTISLIFDFPGDWIAFVHPLVNGLLGNGVVAVLIILKKNKKI